MSTAAGQNIARLGTAGARVRGLGMGKRGQRLPGTCRPEWGQKELREAERGSSLHHMCALWLEKRDIPW